jgi:hypothetical protein
LRKEYNAPRGTWDIFYLWYNLGYGGELLGDVVTLALLEGAAAKVERALLEEAVKDTGKELVDWIEKKVE